MAQNHVPTTEVATPGSAVAPSIVRTVVPLLVGLLTTFLIDRFGTTVDAAMVGAVMTAAVSGVYYAVARFLEVYASPKWGYILGLSRPPVYPQSSAPTNVLVRNEDGSVSLVPDTLASYAAVVFGLFLVCLGLWTTILS